MDERSNDTNDALKHHRHDRDDRQKQQLRLNEQRKARKRYMDALYARNRRIREKEEEKKLQHKVAQMITKNKQLQIENNALQCTFNNAKDHIERTMSDKDKEWLLDMIRRVTTTASANEIDDADTPVNTTTTENGDDDDGEYADGDSGVDQNKTNKHIRKNQGNSSQPPQKRLKLTRKNIQCEHASLPTDDVGSCVKQQKSSANRALIQSQAVYHDVDDAMLVSTIGDTKYKSSVAVAAAASTGNSMNSSISKQQHQQQPTIGHNFSLRDINSDAILNLLSSSSNVKYTSSLLPLMERSVSGSTGSRCNVNNTSVLQPPPVLSQRLIHNRNANNGAIHYNQNQNNYIDNSIEPLADQSEMIRQLLYDRLHQQVPPSTVTDPQSSNDCEVVTCNKIIDLIQQQQQQRQESLLWLEEEHQRQMLYSSMTSARAPTSISHNSTYLPQRLTIPPDTSQQMSFIRQLETVLGNTTPINSIPSSSLSYNQLNSSRSDVNNAADALSLLIQRLGQHGRGDVHSNLLSSDLSSLNHIISSTATAPAVLPSSSSSSSDVLEAYLRLNNNVFTTRANSNHGTISLTQPDNHHLHHLLSHSRQQLQQQQFHLSQPAPTNDILAEQQQRQQQLLLQHLLFQADTNTTPGSTNHMASSKSLPPPL